MRWHDLQPAPRTLRWFAVYWTLLFAALAAQRFFVGNGVDLTLGGLLLAALAGLLGVALPKLAQPVYVGWMVLVSPIHWLVTLLLLALIYYGVVVPLGVLFKLIGRDALDRRFEPERASYWLARPDARDVRSYFHLS